MSERVPRDVPPDDVPKLKSMLEADGYSVMEQAQADGLITLRAQPEWNADIKPLSPWPKPGKG